MGVLHDCPLIAWLPHHHHLDGHHEPTPKPTEHFGKAALPNLSRELQVPQYILLQDKQYKKWVKVGKRGFIHLFKDKLYSFLHYFLTRRSNAKWPFLCPSWFRDPDPPNLGEFELTCQNLFGNVHQVLQINTI
jgi:hypothetical protein